MRTRHRTHATSSFLCFFVSPQCGMIIDSALLCRIEIVYTAISHEKNTSTSSPLLVHGSAVSQTNVIFFWRLVQLREKMELRVTNLEFKLVPPGTETNTAT